MADLVVVPANVVKGPGATYVVGFIGDVMITAGLALYQKDTDDLWYIAQATNDADKSALGGIALNGGVTGQPVVIQTGGLINVGCAITVDEVYFLAPNNGGIGALSSSTVGGAGTTWLSYIGTGFSTTFLKLSIVPNAVQTSITDINP